jgi:hypothetical protein
MGRRIVPRIVLGYHGTHRAAAQAIMSGSPFRLSRNHYDWLGDGVYFWEYGPVRALDWARQEFGEEAVVLRARIQLKDCLDLTDLKGTYGLKRAYQSFVKQTARVGMNLPRQKGANHALDRYLINLLADWIAHPVRVIRAPFVEGERLWDDSEQWDKSHVQLAVRNHALISRVIMVEEVEDEGF